MNLAVLLILAASGCTVMGARILAVLPMPTKSHHILFNAILRTLAEAGHEVVCYSNYPADKEIANLTVVHMPGIKPANETMMKQMLDSILNKNREESATVIWEKTARYIGNINDDKNFMQLMKSNEKFDLVMLEAFFAQEPLFAVSHKFQAPVINLHTFGAFSLVNSVHGNSLNLAFIPDYALSYSDHMTFYQRAFNAYTILTVLFKFYVYYIPKQDQYMRKIFKDDSLPPLSDMMQNNLALTFSNAHPYVQYAQPYTPNIHSIGGIHLAKERTPLPADMKKFLDGSTEGVIYFSVGSVFPEYLLGNEYFDSFLSAFHNLPQRVLWKTKRDIKNLPNNVMTSQWVPQQDVLAHPNVKVFMTHGGLFSLHEAINAGVPVVCTPYFGDQPMNAMFYEEKGIGVVLPFKSLSQENILSALTKVLTDPKYRNNMARLSRIYRDRPVSPADTVLFWVDYVIRHGGAPHLRPASATMPFYQLHLLDVVGTVLVTILLTILILYFVVKRLFAIFLYNIRNVRTGKHKKDR